MRPDVIGVLGAGTMGAGIAQLAAQSGARALLHDPDPAALEKGLESARRRLERKEIDPGRLGPAASLADLAACGLVIEAAPESLELKRELLTAVAAVVGDGCVLASNTSSLPVTAIAAGVPGPERVVGMHFFNPAPVMKLLEVVAGEESSEAALAVARATGEAMERRVIAAKDSVGFLVNRCNRPFALEAMRIVGEGIATPEQVDRICRLGGGFRMGPFELSDLVGIDVGFEISKSFWEQSFHEPRWRPSPLAARLVAAGRFGRKSGRGWYDYDGDDYRPDDPESSAPPEDLAAPPGLDCGAAPLAALDPDGTAIGACTVPGSPLVELTRGRRTRDAEAAEAERGLAAAGRHVEWVGDGPGLVLRRIVCQLVNEAWFALGEGIGSAEDVDAGMVLGLNHPRGPFAWGETLGLADVLATLEGLWSEYRDEAYRPAPALVRAVRTGERPGLGR